MTLDRRMYKNTVGEKFQQHDDDILNNQSEETTVDSLDQISSRAEFGGGAVVIDEDGITIEAGTLSTKNTIKFSHPTDGIMSEMFTAFGSDTAVGRFRVNENGNAAWGQNIISALDDAGNTIGITMSALSGNLSMNLASSAGGEIIVNNAGLDVDFRVEGDNKTDLLKGDAGLNEAQIGGLLKLVIEDVVISSGAISVTQSYVRVDAESGSSDLLNTINGTTDGCLVILRALGGDTITVRDNSVGGGNLFLASGANKTVAGRDRLGLLSDGTNLEQLFYSNN